MISTMRERMSAKMGNNNDNAFKMRKLFKMYDREGSGLVSGRRGARVARTPGAGPRPNDSTGPCALTLNDFDGAAVPLTVCPFQTLWT
jgi:hypothetical protein